MRTSEQINEIATSMAAAQLAFPPIKKSKTAKVQMKAGGQYSYAYADLADIFEAVRPILANNGIAVVQVTGACEQNFILTTRLMHRSGQWIETDFPLRMSGTIQEVGSELTYSRRYALCGILGIAAEEDDDGNAANGNGHKQAAPQRQQQPQRQQNSPSQPAPRQEANPATQQGQPSQGGAAATGPLASPQQVTEIKTLLSSRSLPAGMIESWWNKAGVNSWEKMPADAIVKCISYLKTKKPTTSVKLDFDTFADKAWAIALGKNISNEWFNQAMAKFVEANGGAPFEIAPITLMQALTAMDTDNFDYSLGKAKEPAAASEPAAA